MASRMTLRLPPHARLQILRFRRTKYEMDLSLLTPRQAPANSRGSEADNPFARVVLGADSYPRSRCSVRPRATAGPGWSQRWRHGGSFRPAALEACLDGCH